MKSKCIINLLFFLVSINYALSQSVIVGQHDCSMHYVFLNPIGQPPNGYYGGDYNFDLDGDLQPDFKITRYNSGGLGGNSQGFNIIPIGSNQIAYGWKDSSYSAGCNPTWSYYYRPDTLSINDTIQSNLVWRNTSLTFWASGYLMGGPNGSCNYASPNISWNNKYIGLRVINSTDTLYGWIKLKSDSGFGIEEICCEVKQDEITFLNNISDVTVQCGTQYSYNINVISKSCTSYQWSKDGVILPGDTNNILSLGSITFNDTGLYQCQIINAFDTVYCSSKLSVGSQSIADPPYIPQGDRFICGGSGLSWYVSLEKGQNNILSYQWRKDGIDLPGETNDSLFLTDINDDRTGKYSCRMSIMEVNYCLDTTYLNTIITNDVKLTVSQIPYPVITQIGNRLISNYPTGNTWYYSTEFSCCELLGYDSEVIITRDGKYSVEVNLTGCGSNTEWKNFYVDFTVNPNPVVDKLVVSLPSWQTWTGWELYNGLGQLVQNGVVGPLMNELDLSARIPGVYILKVNGKRIKLIKQ